MLFLCPANEIKVKHYWGYRHCSRFLKNNIYIKPESYLYLLHVYVKYIYSFKYRFRCVPFDVLNIYINIQYII